MVGLNLKPVGRPTYICSLKDHHIHQVQLFLGYSKVHSFIDLFLSGS